MELINIEQSKVIALGGYRFTRGNPFFIDLVGEVTARYNFQIPPDRIPDPSSANGASIHLRVGKWDNVQIDELGVYSDGFIVTAKCNTFILDQFINDLHEYIEREFGILLAKQPAPVRLYESQIVVELHTNFEEKLNVFKGLFDDLAKHSLDYVGQQGEYRIGGFHIESDPFGAAKKLPNFMLVRRVGISFNEGYWWATSGLKTDDHIAVLKSLEKRLLS
ncbi:hypothetical protein IAG41_18125 [Sphingomonas sp. JC676]|uniref:hypothetical protein n=1 Tax=Sphingomonas sp. JC676 TaxID=2768065 RepID=UPI0016581ADE|nr:hypothetical protein [Sphingomonas sp. JC676]MBC9034310.1 hypothetical protein [Sphingomonas sp. JC676]